MRPAAGRVKMPRMGDGATNGPAYWRERAKETRRIAATMRGDNPRRMMEGVAASYDRLAELAERLAQGNQRHD